MADQFNKDIIDGLLHKLPKQKKKSDTGSEKSSDNSGNTAPTPTAPTPMPGGTDIWAPIRPLTPSEDP